jgi:hypothetical protein
MRPGASRADARQFVPLGVLVSLQTFASHGPWILVFTFNIQIFDSETWVLVDGYAPSALGILSLAFRPAGKATANKSSDLNREVVH